MSIRVATCHLVVAATLCSCNVVAWNRAVLGAKYRDLGLVAETVQLSTGRVHYQRGGRGSSTVVLIHGFGGSALETWEHQVGPLAERYRVIAPDLMWFGRSLPQPGRTIDTAAEQADVIAALLDRLRVGKAQVVGVSFGGFVALQLARRHPQYVAKLVLVDAAGLRPTPKEQAAIRASFGNVENLVDVLIPADVDALKRFLSKVFYDPPWMPRVVLKQVLVEEFWKNKAAKRRILTRMQHGGLLPASALREVRARTLLIWGRHDPLIPPSMARRMKRAIRCSQLRFVSRSAHSPMIEQPDRFNRLLLGFIDG